MTIHGHAKQKGRRESHAYSCWASMKHRVKSKRPSVFKYYGSKGISYDPRWESFENFIEDMGECQPGLTLERIDSDKSYCKENCRWASKAEQQRNKSSTRWIEADGNRMCLAEAARKYGVAENTLRARIKWGWSVEDALKVVPGSVRGSRGKVGMPGKKFPEENRRPKNQARKERMEALREKKLVTTDAIKGK